MSTNEEMSLVEHLGELRKRIMWILVVLVIGMVAGLISAKPVIRYLKNIPPADTISWNVFSPWDALRLYMNFGLAVGILITLPVTLYHIWAFVKPGLRETEQKASIIYIPYAFVLFLAGLSFGYWVVFPMAFYFTSSISKSLDITEMYGAAEYFAFMFNIILPLALVFEMPIVVMFLTKIRLLNPKRLHKFRRYAYMLLVILATVITPPDAISAILVALPLIVLYEFSVFMSRFIYRKQLLQDAEWEREFGPK
ncbi:MULTISPECIES: twin-arginine translocase subunit TatC [Paenibacillus]|uniref:Sec-independent protein translocase protein TatC n=1 Tax=Paenibacillus anseongense TaxID=2682845 RepID=A0ABW9U456_9BACL|nr:MULTISPECIES: twin-arginine translocase subunit TatC [Paenibacillus]MBA2943176.1 twin-arginine translocase subunit TatC [Paenibacillus sp. CGMCC 1.16610]MEC0264304.1 twin-arginine translocase subunit TatC [Paenibacillus anseongense]MVQ33673.1 twin-arginine translocase subunit TatC [Paenibacillus anseongense]